MKPRVKVAFLDHHDVSRRGIMAILEQAVSEVQVTHSLTSRMELEQQLCEAAWDVLLMDDMFPKAGDISHVVNHIQLQSPATAVIILSPRLHLVYLHQLFCEGVRGFIYKGEQLEDILLPAIRRVSQGEHYLSPKASFLMLQKSAQPELGALTTRDMHVLQLLRDDLTIKEIGEVLSLDSQSIYRSRNKLREVLGVRTNENIVPTAREKGLL
jgi:DNA-binding NarL/FixJ family response regulator